MDITILFALIILNGVFAMSEIALITARRAQLQNAAQLGDGAAAAAVRLGEDPNRFLSTVQIGITLVGVLSGAFSGATLGLRLTDWLMALDMPDRFANVIGRRDYCVSIAGDDAHGRFIAAPTEVSAGD